MTTAYHMQHMVWPKLLEIQLSLDVHQDIHCGEETHIIPKILSHRVQMFQHFKSAVSEALVQH